MEARVNRGRECHCSTSALPPSLWSLSGTRLLDSNSDVKGLPKEVDQGSRRASFEHVFLEVLPGKG